MKFLAGLISAAAFLCVVHGEVFDIDWKYGMEDADTAICVPPGSQINFVSERSLILTGSMAWKMLTPPSVFHQALKSTLSGKQTIMSFLWKTKKISMLAPTFLTPNLMT